MNTTRGEAGATGHHLIVPFQLADTGQRLLINRGFIETGREPQVSIHDSSI